jgi:hypothetical protein
MTKFMLQKFIQSALLLVVLFTTVQSYAQVSQAPDGIQFQALATDANGHPAAGRVIYVKDAIIAKTATGTIVYSETFKVTASSAGIFTIVLGKGTYASGVSSIANIDWANGPFFLNLKIAVEPTVPTASWNVNNEYVDLGTSQFWSVPYALYAGSVKGLDTKLNITDTAAMLKPYFTAINLKANIESPTFTGTVSGITKAMVGLGNVDNTSDLNKPISTATQAALDLKANASDVTTALALKANTADVNTALALKANTTDVNTALALKANTSDVTEALNLKANAADVIKSLATKVDKVTGKELSTNDYTTAEKTKLAAITGTNTGDQDLSALAVAADVNTALALKANSADVNASLALKANAANVASSLAAKADVVNVNNAIAAINTSLNTKADAVAVNNSIAVINNSLNTKADVVALNNAVASLNGTLATKENTSNKSINITTDAASDTKYPSVKSVKTYVDAQVAGANIADADANTKGKIQLAGDLAGTAAAPTVPGLALKANTSSLSTVATSGSYNDLSNKPTIPSAYTLPTASASVLGGVKVGANLSIDANGVLSATASNNASSITGTLPVANGGTGTTTVAGIKSLLGFSSSKVAIGDQAGQTNQADGGVGVGGGAGANNQGGSAVAIGYVAGYNNQGASSIAIGPNAAQAGQGAQAVAVGFAAGQNGQGANAVAIGTFAGQSGQAANSIAINASGTSTPLNPANAGFYVDPIRNVSTATSLFYDATTKEITYGTAPPTGAINLASGVTGTLPIANGGTGATTATAALTNLGAAPLASPTFTGTVTTDIINTGALSATSVTAPTYASAPKALTYTGSTINWNPAQGLNAAITLTQNSTLSFTAAPPVGSYGTVVLTQDATGNRTITLPSINGVANKVLGSASTSTVALSTAANAKDILNFYFDGSSCYWNIGQGYGSAATAASTNLATSVSGTLAVANGGTGATTLTGLIKGSGTNALTAAVAGTDYQAPITLTTTGTGAATFSGTTLNIPLVSSTVSAGTISGTVAVANGGTGSTVKNFVDLSSNQTIAGAKAFSSDLNIYGITAGRGNSGVSYNTVFGLAALNANTTGNYNNAFGSQALAANIDGYFNSAFGQTSLFKNTSGYDNSAYGFNALNGSVSGSNNSALGSNSAVNNSTGSNNTAIGMSALALNTTGSNNTALGYQANVGANNLTNATAIGNGAIVSASNTIQLGNANVTNVNTSGGLTAASITTPIYASTPQALTDGSTVVWNPVLGLNASVTLAGNRNLTFLSTPIAGSYGTLVVTQDGTGNRTLNLPSAANKVLGSSSTTTIALSTAAGAKDIVNFYYDGTNYFWNVGQGYGSAAASTATNLATGVTGTLTVANGGTGATTLTGYVKGSGTATMTASATIPVADVTGAAPLASPTFTGTPAAPTATAGTNTTQVATTAFVTTAVAAAASTVRLNSDEFDATAAQTSFTLSQTALNSKVFMFINGTRIKNGAFSVSGTTVTYTAANNNNYALVVGDRIQFDYAY